MNKTAKNILILLAAMIIFQPSFAAIAEKSVKKTEKTPKKSVSFGNQAPNISVPFGQSQQKPVPFKFGSGEGTSTSNKTDAGLTVGIKAGASAGLTGAVGDLSYKLDSIVPGAALRGSFGYLTGSTGVPNSKLKIATVNLDAIYSLGTVKTFNAPLNIYVGGGLIYPFKVSSTKSSGAWGAHAYFGSKYLIQENTSIYGELAYTGIKYQADEAAIKGVEAMLGYSYSF